MLANNRTEFVLCGNKRKGRDRIRIPAHIGIIPDGNRRWAQKSGKQKDEGYQFGLEPGLEVLKMAKAQGVQEITFYGFTTDNCKRPTNQFQAFSQACVDAVDVMSSEGISLLVLGNTDSVSFPETLRPYTTRTDLNGGGIKVNLLVNYGWEWDLSSVGQNGGSRKKIMESLQSKDVSRIDLIIRWGGMRRLSGFLPVQSVYADFYVVDNLWPDFQPQDFHDALAWYDKQDVTLGG